MGQLKIGGNVKNQAEDHKCLKKRVLGYKEMLQYEIQKTQCAFGISPNEEILAYQNSNKINIVNLQTSLNIKQIQIKENEAKDQDSIISSFGFFKNNRMMYCIANNLRVQIYRADNRYKQINTIFSQNGCINDIKIINNCQIMTCCQDGSIIVTDFTKKNQILKIPKSSNCSISQIEYDSQNQVIISYSFDKFIKFYQMNGQNIISYQDSNFYYQIQLNNNSNYMIGRSHMSLVLWEIDYQTKQLMKLKEFNNQRIIYRISSLLQSGIILLDSKDLIILNIKDFRIIYRQKHKVKNIIYDRNSNLTTNSNNHLIITCFGFIKILKKII